VYVIETTSERLLIGAMTRPESFAENRVLKINPFRRVTRTETIVKRVDGTVLTDVTIVRVSSARR
jgi:hypothetical protein